MDESGQSKKKKVKLATYLPVADWFIKVKVQKKIQVTAPHSISVDRRSKLINIDL